MFSLVLCHYLLKFTGAPSRGPVSPLRTSLSAVGGSVRTTSGGGSILRSSPKRLQHLLKRLLHHCEGYSVGSSGSPYLRVRQPEFVPAGKLRSSSRSNVFASRRLSTECPAVDASLPVCFQLLTNSRPGYSIIYFSACLVQFYVIIHLSLLGPRVGASCPHSGQA